MVQRKHAISDAPRKGDSDAPPKLIAYRTSPQLPMRIVPAPSTRAWMSATRDRFANRCLPLLIANEAGWFICTAHSVRVTWNGGAELGDLTVERLDGSDPVPAVSHFGHGILTWQVPFLFRTPAGYNLVVRGPTNWPKDGAYALDGIVETDWAPATFTMNWKLTRKDFPVIFHRDEPICMIFPQRRSSLEEFVPEIRDIESDPEEAGPFRRWSKSRSTFLTQLKSLGGEPKQAWQKDYFQGSSPDGQVAAHHQTKLKLRAFVERNDDPHREGATVPGAVADPTAIPAPAGEVSKRSASGHVWFRWLGLGDR